MYIIIMGGGRVGLNLANLLIEDGHDITLIESDESLCSEVAAELDALVICGNGTSSKLLEETNIEDADFFIATTGNDEANLLSCILVKKYNVPTIIARVSNPDHEEAFMEVGIDNVISPEVTAAGLLEKLVTRPNVADLITLGEGDAEIFDMTITNNKVVGKKNRGNITNKRLYNNSYIPKRQISDTSNRQCYKPWRKSHCSCKKRGI